jgi:hypothetical protein
VLIVGYDEFHGNGRLAGNGKIEFYPAHVVVAEGKSLVASQRYAGDNRAALLTRHDVVLPRADGRGGPEARVAYKKLAWQF